MAKRKPIVAPDIPALVKKHILPNERIDSIEQERPDALEVWLSVKNPEVDKIVEQFGLGGSGRTLHFKFVGNHWKFIEESTWRS